MTKFMINNRTDALNTDVNLLNIFNVAGTLSQWSLLNNFCNQQLWLTEAQQPFLGHWNWRQSMQVGKVLSSIVLYKQQERLFWKSMRCLRWKKRLMRSVQQRKIILCRMTWHSKPSYKIQVPCINLSANLSPSEGDCWPVILFCVSHSLNYI